MKKYLILILFIIIIASCTRDPNIKRIASSFKQFVGGLEIDNTAELDKNMPFLSNMTNQEQFRILKPFMDLENIKYDLEITKKSETEYYLQIKTKDPDSIWSDLFIPYQQDIDGHWVMAPAIKSVKTFDIIPAQN